MEKFATLELFGLHQSVWKFTLLFSHFFFLRMDPILLENLCKEFPGVDALAAKRLVGNGSIFFHRSHKSKFSEAHIFAALFLAVTWARKAGIELNLSDRELRIWKKHLKPVKSL
jgi:hypothetical protein